MRDNVDELHRLMAEGYEIDAIESDDDCVEATLRRGGRIAIVRLRRSDAERILYARPGWR